MSGLFGVVSEANCSETLFYGTDYHSHLGTEFGGLAVLGDEFSRRIHDLSQSQFKSKFFDDCRQMIGKLVNQGADLVDGIERMFGVIEGSCSLLLLTRAGIYVARDRFGYTPLVVATASSSVKIRSFGGRN